MDFFFTANDIGPDKQVSIYLTVVGSRKYALIKSLTAPTLPQEKSYEDLKAVLLAHFRPKPLLIAERFRFYQRNQTAGESVHDFLADLRSTRRLTITCEFEDFLDQALRNRFVWGLRADGMQKRLLTEPDLNIALALELARSIEAAASETKDSRTQAALQAPQAKSSMSEEPPPSHRAEIRRGPVHRVDPTTTRDGHASTGKPSVTFVVKMATSHLSVEEVQQRKL